MTVRYTTNEGNKGKRSSLIRCIKPVMLILAICTTVLLFTLPIVFYYLTAYTDLANAPSAKAGYSNSINQTANNNLPYACDSSMLSWGVIEDSVAECEPYSGTICLPYLIQWNQCILPEAQGGDQEEKIQVAVNSNGKIQDIEKELSRLNDLLVNFPECQPIAIPFLCHYYFPLMTAGCQSTTVNDDQPLYTITQEDCIIIRGTICTVPWQLAVSYSYSLPDCQSLPNTNVSVKQMNMSSFLIPISNESVSCRDDFILINSTCYPRCDRFEEQSHDSTRATLISEVLGAVIAAFLSGIAFILALYNKKRMFRFPSFFLLLFVGEVFVASMLYLINAINRTKLNCSSINLLEVLNNPTLFCYIAGALYHYSLVNLVIWWFIHQSIFFYEVMFPFHARHMREIGRLNKLFVLLLILGFLIPISGVIVGLTSRKHHYNLIRFPPSVCAPSRDLLFYSAAFPITVLLCAGTCLLIIMLWKINRQKTKATKSAKKGFTTAEKKLIIISVMVILYGSYLMVYLGISTGNIDKASEAFTNYFLCESTGHVPEKCNKKDVERHIYPEFNVLTFILMGVIPLVVVNFIINWESLWKSMKHSLIKVYHR